MYLTLVAISLCRGVISYVNIFKIDIIIPVKQQWFYSITPLYPLHAWYMLYACYCYFMVTAMGFISESLSYQGYCKAIIFELKICSHDEMNALSISKWIKLSLLRRV